MPHSKCICTYVNNAAVLVDGTKRINGEKSLPSAFSGPTAVPVA